MERKLIAVTSGDPAGIGPEICLELLARWTEAQEYIPVVFADAAVLKRVGEIVKKNCDYPVLPLAEWEQGSAIDAPTIVDCAMLDAAALRPGTLDAECGRAAYKYIEESIKAALAGRVAAVATGPINKEALHMAGVPYAGHTEIFAALTGTSRYCMMLTADELTVSFVTTHVGYADAIKMLNVERVLEVIGLTAEAMRNIRGRKPHLMVCGINPHAGEHGVFGNYEEEEYIAPAIATAVEMGINVTGPMPADTVFIAERRKDIDAIICIYHDQGHIPFKMLAFDTGVNVTLGLPVVRTSVDHGTAFDIAWKGIADAGSLVAAVELAVRLAEMKKRGKRTR